MSDSIALACGTLLRYARLWAIVLLPGRTALAPRTVRHYLVSLAILLLLPVGFLYHGFGLMLDEILFRGYRRIPVRQPVFILGVPRSGTTFLHHTLAGHEGFTTLRAWECLFAISITWRRVWSAAAVIDRRLGRPLGRLAIRLERKLLRNLQAVHPVGLDSPEEDYFVLLPLLHCFLLAIPFPEAPWLWRMGRFDAQMPAAERARLARFYRRCIQRHLYVHGPDRRFLAKNPAFSPWAGALATTFPDAVFLACLREPATAVSSQLSSLNGGFRSCHGRAPTPAFRDRLIAQLHFYYEHLLDTLGALPPHRAIFLPSAALRDGGLPFTLPAALAWLGVPLPERFRRQLALAVRQSARASARHRHQLADFGLDRERVDEQFADIRARFDFTATTPLRGPDLTPVIGPRQRSQEASA